MPFTPLQITEIIECMENYNNTLRPEDEAVRKQLDYGYKIEGQSVFLLEIRPQWDKPEIIHEHAPKTTYVKHSDHWKIYWLRANLKWYPYNPAPVVKSLNDFTRIVGEDAHGCFFG